MPISKSGKKYYTPEQYEKAKSISALEYAQRRGYDLICQSGYYKLREHDSMVFTPQGRWFWNSRGVHGGALEFIVHYEGKPLTEAVLILAGDLTPADGAAVGSPPAQPVVTPSQYKPFLLPERAQSYRRLYGYLCGARGLSKQVLQRMIQQKAVYQSVSSSRDGKQMHNACFVSYDGDGKACGAYQRGMASEGKPFKREVPGSNKSWGWLLSGECAERVCVFEAAIDAASYCSILAAGDIDPFHGCDYLALGGLAQKPLENYLARHPKVRSVTLMLDADRAGQEATERFVQALKGKELEVDVRAPSFGKDWNDTLRHLGGAAPQASGADITGTIEKGVEENDPT